MKPGHLDNCLESVAGFVPGEPEKLPDPPHNLVVMCGFDFAVL